jgi:predicted membrane-bound spermidine synthase
MNQHETTRLTLDEARWRVFLSLATPPLLVGMAALAYVVEAPALFSLVLALLALVLGYVALFDYARAVEIDQSGVTRICVLRRETIPWEEVAAIVQSGRRGLVLVTRHRKRRVLLDRGLIGTEDERLREQTRLHGVEGEF